MHKYIPCMKITSLKDGYCQSFSFPETSFIAVTAYQSDDVSKNHQSYQSLFMLLFLTMNITCNIIFIAIFQTFFLASCPLYNCVSIHFQVTDLKINHNPYARAFRGGHKAGGHYRLTSSKRTSSSSTRSSRSSTPFTSPAEKAKSKQTDSAASMESGKISILCGSAEQ